MNQNEIVQNMLADIASGGSQAPTPAEVQQTEAPANPSHEEVQPTGAEETKAEVKAEEVKEVEKPVEETEVKENAKEESVEETNIVEDWAQEETESPSTETAGTNNEPDYSALAKELGVEASTKDELLKALGKSESPAKAEAEKVEDKDTPQALKDAMEFAQNGGNYMDYLSVTSTDYDKVSDDELLENAYKQHFERVEELFDYVDGMDAIDKKVRAAQIREGKKAEQAMKLEQMRTQQAQAKQAKVDAVRQAVDSVSDINGFKVNTNQRNKVFDQIVNGTVFQDKNGAPDYSKMVSYIMKGMYFDQVTDYMKGRTRNEQKREMLDNMSNPNIKGTSSGAGNTGGEPKGLDFMLQQMQSGKSFRR